MKARGREIKILRGDFMTAIISIMVLAAVFGGAVWALYLKESVGELKRNENNAMYIIAVMAAGVIANIIAAACYYGHETDMACFVGWSSSAFEKGLGQFYVSEGFHDYPPGYIYVLYLIGTIRSVFDMQGIGLQILIKLPAIIANLVTGYFVYKIASKKFSDEISSVFAALIVLNPAYILVSSIWGQVDSILTLFCILAVYYTAEKRYTLSYFMFAIAVLIKPQALFFTPVLIYGIIDFVRSEDYSVNKLVKILLSGVGAVAFMFVTFMPFGSNPIEGITVIVEQYIDTLAQYPYMTVNAFNIYGAIGKNWAGLTTGSSIIGYGVIVLIVAYSAYVFFKSKSPAKYYLSSFILVFGMFMLAVKMHERYAFPGMAFLLLALIAVPNTKSFLMYGLFSLSQFFNTAWILFIYQQDINHYFRSPVVTVASLINVILSVAFVYIIQKDCVHYSEPTAAKINKGQPQKKKQPVKKISGSGFTFRVSEKFAPITRFDIIAIAAIGVVYSIIALYNLGNMYAPETETVISDGAVTVDLGSEKEIAKTEFYLGPRQLEEDRNLVFTYYDENMNVVLEDNNTSGSVFCWTMRDTEATARYVRISTDLVSSKDEQLMVKEVCFLDSDGNQIEPVNKDDEGVANLFDEQWMMAEGKSFMSGTYFDEIYHARTAYEFIHHLSVYEWTHPPLGKVLIGIGILIFGMVPFGWRIVGTVFGIMMIPVIYVFAKRMMKRSWLALAVCLLFTFDFMHFAQTRIATIDVYVTFFIMLMYYFMYKYYKLSFNDTPLLKTFIPLGLSGIFFGLAVASKWTGLYAGAGLAVIFFYTIYERYAEYRYAMRTPNGKTGIFEHRKVIASFKNNTIATLAFCVVFFIIIPIIIYTLSYIPYLNTPSGNGLRTIIDNADSMFTYHSKTVADSTHPYSSHWFEWPIMYRPIWYFSNTLDNGLKQGISSFGNPAVWWLGIGAFAYMTALAIVIPLKKKQYFGLNKYAFGGMYALVFALCCAAAYASGSGNEKLVRLFPCIVLYSAVMVGVFMLTLTYDDKIKQVSNRVPLFLVIAYLAELMPWMAVVRTTYIYHYFPCVPFVVLMLGYSIKTFYENCEDRTPVTISVYKRRWRLTIGSNKCAVIVGTFVYVAVALILFAMFYPVLSGAPCSYDYAVDWLKWFDSWVLL